jgi:hypothetical protein
MTSLLLASAVVLLNLLLAVRFRPSPFHICLLFLSTACLGFVGLGITYADDAPAALYVAALFSLSGAYWLGRVVISSKSQPYRRSLTTTSTSRTVWGLAATGIALVLLVLYHYSKVGIPVFAADVETRRFAFTESGLFGLPSRAVLFGVVIYFFACWSAAGMTVHRRSLVVIAAYSLALLALTRIASGFRSGLLELTVYVAFALTLRSPEIRWQRAARLLVPVAGAVLFAILLGGRYETLIEEPIETQPPGVNPGPSPTAPVASPSPGLPQLTRRAIGILERATGGAAEPGYAVLTRRVGLPAGDVTLTNDLRYYIPRYLQLTPPADAYPFVKIVSAELYGTPLTRDSFIVPVTVGALPVLVYDLGIVGVLLFCALGALYSLLEAAAQRASSPAVFAAFATAIVALTEYLTKGDLLFEVLNWSAMLVVVGMMFIIARSAAAIFSDRSA